MTTNAIANALSLGLTTELAEEILRNQKLYSPGTFAVRSLISSGTVYVTTRWLYPTFLDSIPVGSVGGEISGSLAEGAIISLATHLVSGKKLTFSSFGKNSLIKAAVLFGARKTIQPPLERLFTKWLPDDPIVSI